MRIEILGLGGSEPFLDSPVHSRVQSREFTSLPMKSSIRVAVVSEERMFREAVTVSLSGYEGMAVAGFSGGQLSPAGEQAAHSLDTADTVDTADTADVVLIDAAPDRQGALARTWAAGERWPEAKLIALGLDREDDTVVDFIEAGARGYVLKGESPDGLVAVIRAVHQGSTPCSPAVVASVLARIAALGGVRTDPPPRSVEPLTQREREVLALLGAGLGNKEVGRRLSITVQTVKNHVHRILEKLQVHRRREAVRLAYDLGLLAEPREIAQLRDRSREQSNGGEKA